MLCNSRKQPFSPTEGMGNSKREGSKREREREREKKMYEGKLEFLQGRWGHRANPLYGQSYTLYLGLEVEDPQARGGTY